jgi:universal stress protein A
LSAEAGRRAEPLAADGKEGDGAARNNPEEAMKIRCNSGGDGVTVELRSQDEQLLERGLQAANSAASPFALRTILVPVDFSGHTAKALAYAHAFQDQFGARLVLVHVVEPTVVPDNFGIIPPAYEEMNGLLRQTAEERLGALAGDSGKGGRVAAVVCVGRASWEIVRLAREHGADLIILATHGHSGLKHVLLGSTAEYVVRHAPCPVLTVREREQDFIETV